MQDYLTVTSAGNRGGPLPALHDFLHTVPVQRLVYPHDSGSPASETITDRFIHNAYEVLVDGHVSMHERNGLKSSHTEGGEEDYDGPFNPAYFPCELEMDLMIF